MKRLKKNLPLAVIAAILVITGAVFVQLFRSQLGQAPAGTSAVLADSGDSGDSGSGVDTGDRGDNNSGDSTGSTDSNSGSDHHSSDHHSSGSHKKDTHNSTNDTKKEDNVGGQDSGQTETEAEQEDSGQGQDRGQQGSTKENDSQDKNEQGNTAETEQSDHTGKKVEPTELEDYQKPDKAQGQTDAQLNKDNSEKIVKDLQMAAQTEATTGNTRVSDQIRQVAQEQEQTQVQTADAISAVQSRNKVMNFLVGTDYKNLGQLRSSLVQNRNEIRQLTETLSQTTDPTVQTSIETQLETLMQERSRIENIITTNQDGFSLFGWVSRFLNNYEQTPINTQEDDQLATEVEDAINNANGATDNAGTAGTATTTSMTGTTGTTSN